MINKLQITGHVHNRPHQPIQQYRHWPEGISLCAAYRIIDAFSKAFTLAKAELTSEPRQP